jgi:hypothetical protein
MPLGAGLTADDQEAVMSDTDVSDKPWTPLKVDGLEGAYRVHDGRVQVRYQDREKTVDAEHFVPPLANAAAEGLARLALAELIGHADGQ